jgi:MFS family permease
MFNFLHQTIYLIIYFLINSVAFGLTAVPRMNLIVSLVCRHVLQGIPGEHEPVIVGGHNAQCAAGDMSSKTALVASYGLVIMGIFSAVMSPLMGSLSDKVGRIKVLGINMTGIIFSEIVLLLVASLPEMLDYRWIYLAYAIDGLGGSFATAMSLSSAYVSDCNNEEDRNVHIGEFI